MTDFTNTVSNIIFSCNLENRVREERNVPHTIKGSRRFVGILVWK
jgi:hypothetical protein